MHHSQTRQGVRPVSYTHLVMNAKAPMMIAGNDKPGFKIDLHIKDLNNVLDCAHAVGAPAVSYTHLDVYKRQVEILDRVADFAGL